MKLKRQLIAALFLPMVSGCSMLHAPANRSIQANLLSPCQPLDAVEVSDLGELLDVSIETSGMYRACAEKHKALASVCGAK